MNAPNQPQANKPPAITPAMALDVLRRWWVITFPAGLVIAGIAGAVVMLTVEPKYRAKALLWIDSKHPFLVYDDGDDQKKEDYVNNQLGLIRSPVVLADVVSSPEIASLDELTTARNEEPTETLGRLVSVSPTKSGELFELTCTSTNPQNAKVIVNAVANSYLARMQEFESERTEGLIEILTQEQEYSETKVKILRDNVREMTKQLTGRDPFAGVQAPANDPIEPSQDLQGQLITAQVDHAVLEAQLEAFQKFAETNPIEVSEAMIDEYVEQHPDVRETRMSIAAKVAEMRQVQSRAALSEQDAAVRQRQRVIERDEQALEEVIKDIRQTAAERLKDSLSADRNDAIRELEARRDELVVRQQVLAEVIKDFKRDEKQFKGETLELEFRRGELANAEDVHNRIAERVQMLRTEQRAPGRVKLLREATVPKYPIEKYPVKQMMMASCGGFAIPFVLAFLWELRIRRISSAKQLQEDVKVPVIGEIANFTSRSRRAARNGQLIRAFEESVDNLRTDLFLAARTHELQALVVTSAISSEGKTTVAAQLAISIAQATGEPTLLIDGDLRAPDLHFVFDQPVEPGLAMVLDHRCSFREAITNTTIEHLDFLPAGRLHKNPHKLFGNGGVKSMLAEARGIYQWIVIDTPPVLSAGESLVLAKAADETILCVRRDRSRLDQVRRTFHRLAAASVNYAGAVFNGTPQRSYAYTYGSYAYAELPT